MRVFILSYFAFIFSAHSNYIIDQERLVPLKAQSIESRTEDIVSKLSLKEKIGQMFMFGFKGKTAEEDAFRLIDEYKPGGLILFTRNIGSKKELIELNHKIKQRSTQSMNTPIFIAIDQEGGKVARITDFGTVLPGNMNLGATGSTTLSFLAGKLSAVDLEMLGINMNLAPVLDVNTNAMNEVIGVRSFGADPDMVAMLGSAYIRGLQSRRVSATAKHFPGHGNTVGDSHFETPVLERNEKDFRNVELSPFYSAIKDDVDAMMTAHISVPSIDKTKKPATLSKKIITDLLRNEMGYKGLVITDDMEMRAVLGNGGLANATVEAVKAGCDLITVVWTESSKKQAFNALLSAVKKGEISEKRIDESVRRIIAVKLKRDLYNVGIDPNIEEIKQTVGNSLHKEIAELIAQRSITLVKNHGGIIPLNTKQKIVLLSPFSYLSTELKNSGLNNSFIRIKVKMGKNETASVLKKIKQLPGVYSAYIIGGVDDSHAELANELKKISKNPVIFASLDSPYMYASVTNVDAYLCAYSFRVNALQALAKVLVGTEKAQGKLPVNLENVVPIL